MVVGTKVVGATVVREEVQGKVAVKLVQGAFFAKRVTIGHQMVFSLVFLFSHY